MSGPVSRLVDIVFPTDTNHHGTLFGGVGLAHMDKVAFVAATRHGRAPFVTASCERIDFVAPAWRGDLVDVEGRVTRVGRRSLSVEVSLTAEDVLTGERRLCCRGMFNMVALKQPDGGAPDMPPLPPREAPDPDAPLKMVELVFPDRASHYGALYGGEAMAMMGKAAFIAASRYSRKVMVLASSQRIDFRSPVAVGDVVELIPRVVHAGARSVRVSVEFWSETLLSGERRLCAESEFVMVAVKEPQEPPVSHM